MVDKIIIWAEKATFLQQPRNTSVRDRFLCIRAKAPGFFVYRSILPAKRVPLYIGKSKKISGRVHQHIYSAIEKTTFALKLNAREHAKKELFRLSIIPIPYENYNWIVPVVENTLRNQLNPIIGKQ